MRNTYSPLVEGDHIRCQHCGKPHIVQYVENALYKDIAPLYYMCDGKPYVAALLGGTSPRAQKHE